MKRGDWLLRIMTSGKDVYEIQTDNPKALAENLRRGARLRGFLWTFATEEKRVIVYVRQA